ncbi:MAG: T9SS type A sorting domain-containing protein [Bacteroidetes bacterium]|nr:T9SS type A sorting domain-containing protein [Bacteroidota bacterium]
MKTLLLKNRIDKLASVLLFFIIILGQRSFAQTNPTAQSLPYSQTFGTNSFSALPAGIAVWTPGSQQTSEVAAEASTATGDIAISARTTTTGTAGVYGYATGGNASLYIQTGTGANGTGQVVAAVNTGSNTSLTISYQLSRLANTSGNRTAGVSLLYRVISSSTWNTTGSVITNVNSTTNNSITIGGLTANTVYQFLWVTWTGGTNGTYIGIGLDNISIQATTTRTWIGGATGNWNTSSNWSGNTVPADGDAVVFNTAAAVSVNTNPANISSLTITNSSTVSFTTSGAQRELTLTNVNTSLYIDNGASLSLNGSTGSGTRSMILDFSGSGNTSTILGTLNVNATGDGSSFDATNSTTTVSGSLVNNGGSITSNASNLIFANGGVYNHAIDGGTIPTATWNTGSTCEITGNSGSAPTGLNPTGGFANFTWNSPGQSGTDNVSLAGALKTINGNFSIISTGSGTLRLLNSGNGGTLSVGGNFSQTGGIFYIVGSGGNNTTETLEITGDFSITGGILRINGATTGNSNTATINIGGNFGFTGGTIAETANNAYTSTIHFDGSGTQTYSDGGSLSGTINFVVDNGATLQMGTGATPAVISNGSSGTFTLSSGASLGVTSTAGISATGGTTGNIQVTGTRTFNTGCTYIYEGISAQITGSGLPVSVTNLYIQTANSSNVSLTNTLTVTGSLRLISGTVDASTNSLTMNTGSTISGGSSSSYVVTGNGSGNGGLTINSVSNSSSKLFPIGTLNYYLPATVSPSTSGLSWTAKVFTPAATNGQYGGPAFSTAALQSMVNAIWTITPSNTSTTAALTLDWTSGAALEGSAFAVADNSVYGISHYNGTSWDAATRTGGSTATTVTSSFSSFSPFGVGISGDPLPMILVDFNAVMDNNKSVDLSWSTEMEQNSSHFNVLRSADGSSWSVIGIVEAKGNSSIVSNYSFTDQNPLSSVNYYRLQMVDLDGKYSYSEIKVVKASLINGLSIFPNPAKDYINVSVGGSSSSLTIRLINQSGQILQEKIVNSASSSVVSMPVYSYPQGNYYLQVTSADGSQQTSKVLITR